MALTDTEIGKILVEESYLDDTELQVAVKSAKERKLPLLTILMEGGIITQHLYESALCEHYKLTFYDLQSHPPAPDTVTLIPEEVARKYSVVVVEKKGNALTIATSDPSQDDLEDAVKLNLGKREKEEIIWPASAKATAGKPAGKKAKRSSLFSLRSTKEKSEKFTGKVTVVFAPEQSIESAFHHYRKPLATRFQSIIKEQGRVAPEILEEILNDAIELRSSDIHFEPQENIVIVRFRVDGVLHEAGRIPKQYYEGVVNRVKIASDLRTDEHFAAQDGAIRHETSMGKMDVRVSIVPIVDGEKIVMRLLASYVRSLTLLDLGFSEKQQKILTEIAQKPFGMILATGPTGSGKSTTLSALIKMRNSPDVNISTIEDPVEYKIAGVNHIQVNTETDLTFASGLRSLVRQDPDIIYVGEIRDGETADISVNAALTGHLLFSTLHANTAPTAIPRLLDMGVEPFLIASTLEVVIGQRLVRRICPHCRYSYTIAASEARELFSGAQRFFSKKGRVTLYRGKGCDSCGGTGYRSRVGIYELLIVTPEIEELIIKRASSTDIMNLARKQGMRVMFEDGFDKVVAGITTIEELRRTAAPPDILLSSHGKRKREK